MICVKIYRLAFVLSNVVLLTASQTFAQQRNQSSTSKQEVYSEYNDYIEDSDDQYVDRDDRYDDANIERDRRQRQRDQRRKDDVSQNYNQNQREQSEQEPAGLGVTVTDHGNRGVRRTPNFRGSPADEAGLTAERWILEVDGERVNSPERLVPSIRRRILMRKSMLLINRNGRTGRLLLVWDCAAGVGWTA